MSNEIKNFVRKTLDTYNGLLHLLPTWVPRSFCIPGRRLKLHVDDLFALGTKRGGIDERWFSSTCPADNGPGTPEDEGLSYVYCDGKKELLKDIIAEMGNEILGDKIINKWGGLKVFAKFFDNMDALPHHIHLDEAHAKNVGMEGKPEAYYFPPQLNFTENNFPYTFFGLEPGTTKEQVRKCLIDFEKGDNKITNLSKAYRLEPGTGWLLPPGVLHAPGSLCSFEPQWASDVYGMYQSVVANKPIDRALLVKDVPDKYKNDLDYIMDIIDWDLNVDPNFKERFHLKPVPIGNTKDKGYEEKWIVYGKVNGKEVFSAKELTVYSGTKVTIKDNGAYGLITVQGHGKINDVDFESPNMIRFGDITKDEFFVPYPTAIKGVTVENTGCEPLVMLKFFGPDNNPDMPEKK
ncbi:MAG: hypothetical protein M1479_04520 [Actinobacteria bacterium]|nr:hypothetical protein [Cyanobacteriota bacterium]MCL5771521.1 hypothetical protein [Actinomycetota bacterium]